MILNYHCCICKQSMLASGPQAHSLDPCALIIVAHIDKEWRDQKEQTFYGHIERFRRLVADDSVMYIMEPHFSTNGQTEAELAAEETDGDQSPA
jgi:hypothetical protein